MRAVYFLLSGSILALDRLSKWLVEIYVPVGSWRGIWGRAVGITKVYNSGGAFGLLAQHRALFLLISGGVPVGLGVLFSLGRPRDRWLGVGLALIWAGAIGNFIDRLSFGYVIDFIRVTHFSVFNVADSAIVVGTAILALRILSRGR